MFHLIPNCIKIQTSIHSSLIKMKKEHAYSNHTIYLEHQSTKSTQISKIEYVTSMFPILDTNLCYLDIKDLKVTKFQKSSFLPKYQPKIVRISPLQCGTIQGRNPYNILFIFWEKRQLHKFILKFTDLYFQQIAHTMGIKSI